MKSKGPVGHASLPYLQLADKYAKRLPWLLLIKTVAPGPSGPGQTINVWRPNTIKHCLVTVWTPCLLLFDRVWSCLIKFEGHQTFKQQLKTFLLYSCLMGDLLFVWTWPRFKRV